MSAATSLSLGSEKLSMLIDKVGWACLPHCSNGDVRYRSGTKLTSDAMMHHLISTASA